MAIKKIKIGNSTAVDVNDARIGSTITGVSTSVTSGSSDATLPTAAAVYNAIDSAVTSVLKYKGTIGSSGATVDALPANHKVGDVYVVSVDGTYAGKSVEVGDYIICKISGTVANDSHWDVVNGENQVDNKNATLSWGNQSTIATVDGTDIKVTMPSKPTYSEISGTPTIPTKVSELDNDSGFTTNTGTVTGVTVGTTAYNPTNGIVTIPAYPTTLPASDVSAWAKASTKPSYSYSEISGTPTLGTAAAKNVPSSGNASTTEVVMGNDSRLTDSRPASDVSSWAKAASKPSYALSELSDDSTHRVVTDIEKSTWNAKYDKPSEGIPKTDLSSGVQTSLDKADNAIPVEGITEVKTGQEFVYRKSPQTIKSKALTIDRIKGKTLAWNQLVPNIPPVEKWIGSATATFTNTTNLSTATITSAGTLPMYLNLSILVPNGHKVCFSFDIKPSVALPSFYYVAGGDMPTMGKIYKFLSANVFTRCSCVQTLTNRTQDTKTFPLFRDDSTSLAVGDTIVVKNVKYIDLSILYGSAIDGMTDAEILAKFESEYPGYHSYDSGSLISNAAAGLETVGRNLCDEDFEPGVLNLINGDTWNKDNSIRSKNFIPALPNTAYYFQHPTSSTSNDYDILWYDENKNFISYGDRVTNVTSPANARFFKINDRTTATYNNNLCVNFSDTDFNGQYEPYKSNVLPLNLNDFWVKDSNGVRHRIQGGLKQAGDVCDEIVGNKYIKRLVSVAVTENSPSGLFGVHNASGGAIVLLVGNYYGEGNRGGQLISTKYTRTTAETIGFQANKTIRIPETGSYDKQLCIKDTDNITSGMTAEQARTFLNGIEIVYELDTPIEYVLETPLVLTMTAGTTERRLPEDTASSVLAPFCADMTYSVLTDSVSDVLKVREYVDIMCGDIETLLATI